MNPATLHIETFVESTFGENSYVLNTTDDNGLPIGWVIDPSFPPSVEDLLDYIARSNIRIERIILTHGHLDHIAGLDAVRQEHPTAKVAMSAVEQPMLSNPQLNLSEFMGMPLILRTRPDEDLRPGSELPLGALTWQVLDVSGHSPGGRALYCPEAHVVFTGDALFSGGIGRTDFPGSDGHRLLRNIHANLFKLPDETVLYSGHGPTTTIGNERKFNPFLSD